MFDPLIQADLRQDEEAVELGDDGGEVDDEEEGHGGADQEDGGARERDAEGHGEAGQSEDQAAEQSQHGDTRPDGGTMTRDGLGDGAGDQEQDQPAGMESWHGVMADAAQGRTGQAESDTVGTRQHGVAHYWNR